MRKTIAALTAQTVLTALAALALLAAAGCSNPFSPLPDSSGSGGSAGQTAPGTAALSISFSTDQARSILPSGFDAASYDVTLAYTDGSAGIADRTQTGIDAAGGSAQITDLPLGEWDLTVEAFDSSDGKIGEASKTLTLTEGANSTSIEIQPLDSDGTLQVSYQWDTGAADAASFSLADFNGANPPSFAGSDQTGLLSDDGGNDTITKDIGAGTAELDVQLPAGDYILTLQLSLDGNNQPPIRKHVRIFGNLTSSAAVDLTGTTLARMPENPTGITAEATDPSTLRISWESDDPLVEGYHLTRQGGSGDPTVFTIPAGTTHYDDTTFDHSVIHTYSVTAYNSVGETTPVAGESAGSGTVVLLGVESHEFGGEGKDIMTDSAVDSVTAYAYISGTDHSDPANIVGTADLYIQDPVDEWGFFPDHGLWFEWLTAYVPTGTGQLDFEIYGKDSGGNVIYRGTRNGVDVPTPDIEGISAFATTVPPEKVTASGLPERYYPTGNMPDSFSISFDSPNPYADKYRYWVESSADGGSTWSAVEDPDSPGDYLTDDGSQAGGGAGIDLSTDLTLPALPDAAETDYRIRFSYGDSWGNWTDPSAAENTFLTSTVDAPVISLSDPVPSGVTSAYSITVAVTSGNAEAYKYSLDGGTTWTDNSGNGFELTTDITADPNASGLYTAGTTEEFTLLVAGKKDGLWFETAGTAEYTWTIDQVEPTLELTMPVPAADLPAGQGWESGQPGISFQGSAGDDHAFSEVLLRVRDGADGDWTSPIHDWQAFLDAPGSFGQLYDNSGSLSNGTYDVEIKSADIAGNESDVLFFDDIQVYNGVPNLTYTQTSSVDPSEIAAGGGDDGVYNWDQTVTASVDAEWPGDIEYSVDGGGSWQDYSGGEADLSLTHGDQADIQFRTAFGGTAGGETTAQEGYTYTIDYHRYSLDVSVNGGSGFADRGSGRYTSPGDDITVEASYTPVCGETFSIYRYTENIEMEETDLPSPYNANGWADWPLAVHYNRLDTFTSGTGTSELTAGGGQTTPYSGSIAVHLDPASGRTLGGIHGARTQRNKFFLKVAGRPYAADPASSTAHNPDLSAAYGNVVRADAFIVFPKLSISALEMKNRPEITPYLWTKEEPIVQAQVQQTDYFSGAVTAAEADTELFFRIQYGIKDFPYGQPENIYGQQPENTIFWQDNINEDEFSTGGYTVEAWQDPDLQETPLHITAVGQPLLRIKVDPFGSSNRHGGTETLIPPDGWAYYQIDNPYDTARMGEAAHYSELAGTTGELDNRAFRTVVRFRTRAWKSGFRASQVKKSFESDTAATFDVDGTHTVNGHTVRRLDAGIDPKPSDLTDGYTSYPIEVYEHYEGWGSENPLGEDWYQKHGITWYGQGKTGAQNNPDKSRNHHFDTTKDKAVIYSHGWQNSGYYEITCYTATGTEGTYNATDYSSWHTTVTGGTGIEWSTDYWRNQGWNVGLFHWNKMAQGQQKAAGFAVAMPGSAEKKIWYPGQSYLNGAGFMTMHSESTAEGEAEDDNAMADACRSASVGMIFAQDVLDSFPSGYNPTELIFLGHSLGNNVVMNGAEKIIAARERGATIPESRIPTRVDLVDPYWGNNDDGIYTWVSGDTVRAYSDILHDYHHSADDHGIPIQWYKTSALTQTYLTYSDSNHELMNKTNYTKFYLGTCDDGYIQTDDYGWTTFPTMNGDLHSAAHKWWFRSIQRSQDNSGTINGDGSGGGAFISAASQTEALWSRLNSMRGFEDSTFQWYEMDQGSINNTLDTEDDYFHSQDYNPDDMDMDL